MGVNRRLHRCGRPGADELKAIAQRTLGAALPLPTEWDIRRRFSGTGSHG